MERWHGRTRPCVLHKTKGVQTFGGYDACTTNTVIQSQQCVHTGDVTKRVYYVCCRDGNYRSCTKQNQTGKKRPHQKDTRKLNDTCISRIYVDYYIDGHVTVTHITAHTNHQPC